MVAATAEGAGPRVLFFAETVTLAHIARPVVLARALADQGFDVHLARAPRYLELFGELPFTEHELDSITPQQFMAALAAGKPLYELSTLEHYVAQDLRLMEQVAPDIVVGDFRLSLAVSAELAGVPYVALSNAYWSPYCRQAYTVPELPFVRLLGPRPAQAMFSMVRPLAFAMHCLPMHRLRRRHGLRSLGFDLGSVYTHADCTLYADVPSMFDMAPLPPSHRFIGPVAWSPDIAAPPWWEEIRSDRPLVYVTLGSSGQVQCLPVLLEALGQLELEAMVATAGAVVPGNVPGNVRLADYLPGEAAASRADLVICNGGSPTAHQALSRGVPVLGLAGNLDQYLNMQAVVKGGAGKLLRSGSATASEIGAAVTELLQEPGYRAAAGRLGRALSSSTAVTQFPRIINDLQVSWRSSAPSREG